MTNRSSLGVLLVSSADDEGVREGTGVEESLRPSSGEDGDGDSRRPGWMNSQSIAIFEYYVAEESHLHFNDDAAS